MDGGGRLRYRWWLLAAFAVAGVALVALHPGNAATITGNPLASIHVSREQPLDCQVQHANTAYTGTEADGEFWGHDHCGTFLYVGGFGLFGPTLHGFSTDETTGTPFVVQSETLSGSGTPSDPRRIVTVVRVADPSPLGSAFSFRLQQTDSYVNGDEFYTTTIDVTNTGTTSPSLLLLRGGDCYLPGGEAGTDESDQGYGYYDPTLHIVACTSSAGGQTGRVIEWIPHTPGVTVQEGLYTVPWDHANTGTPFADSCDCASYIDNGAGIAWPFTLAPGATGTFASDNVFALGVAVPSFQVTIDSTPTSSDCDSRSFHFHAQPDPSWGFTGMQWTLDGVAAGTGLDTDATWSAAGHHEARITATTIWQTTTTTVSDVNVVLPVCLPTLDPLPFLSVDAGNVVEVCASGHPGRGGALTYTVTALPASATWEPPCISWTTAPSDEGLHPCIVVTLHEQGTDATATACLRVRVLVGAGAPRPDADQDGVPDDADNCPGVTNRDQADADGDGAGDACADGCPSGAGSCGAAQSTSRGVASQGHAADTDLDGWPDASDDCPAVADPAQEDLDRDGLGDACDADADGDSVLERGPSGLLLDNCPGVPNPGQGDADGDGTGDACAKASPATNLGVAHSRTPTAPAPRANTGWAPLLLVALPAAVAALVVILLLRRGKR